MLRLKIDLKRRWIKHSQIWKQFWFWVFFFFFTLQFFDIAIHFLFIPNVGKWNLLLNAGHLLANRHTITNDSYDENRCVCRIHIHFIVFLEYWVWTSIFFPFQMMNKIKNEHKLPIDFNDVLKEFSRAKFIPRKQTQNVMNYIHISWIMFCVRKTTAAKSLKTNKLLFVCESFFIKPYATVRSNSIANDWYCSAGGVRHGLDSHFGFILVHRVSN